MTADRLIGPGLDTDRKTGPPLDIAAAADALGLTTDAVRKRLTRRQLRGFKRGGRWYVLLDPPVSLSGLRQEPAGFRPDTALPQTGPQDSPDRLEAVYRELVEQQRGEIAFLREELRRKDALLAAAVQRQVAAPAGGPDQSGHQDRSPRRSWWRLWNHP